jgi:hypothetical protein
MDDLAPAAEAVPVPVPVVVPGLAPLAFLVVRVVVTMVELARCSYRFPFRNGRVFAQASRGVKRVIPI